MTPSASRVAAAWILREEACRVASLQPTRQARRNRAASQVRTELSSDVLEAFVAHAVDRVAADFRVAASLGQRLETLWKAFQTAPKAWAEFKAMIGVKGDSWLAVARELPGRIKTFMASGKGVLAHIGDQLAEKIPALRIYLDAKEKLPSFGVWLDQMVDHMPVAVQRVLRGISTKATSLAKWIDEILSKNVGLKVLGAVASAALFAFIWFNVAEISWDIPELIRGFLGGYTFVELFQSLPESAAGLVLKLMFPGLPGGLVWNALLPITVAMRLAWLHRQKLLAWSHGHAQILWDRLGVPTPA